MTEIHRASIQISRPMGTNPGAVEQACYFIDKGNVVVLCHRDGTVMMRATSQQHTVRAYLDILQPAGGPKAPHGRTIHRGQTLPSAYEVA